MALLTLVCPDAPKPCTACTLKGRISKANNSPEIRLLALIADNPSNIGTCLFVTPSGNRGHVGCRNADSGIAFDIPLNHANTIFGYRIFTSSDSRHVVGGCRDFGIALNPGPLAGLCLRMTQQKAQQTTDD